MISSAVAIIVLLVGYIIYATLNSLEEAEDNYTTMRDLKGRAEAADVAKSQVLLSLAVFLSFAMFL
jgi:histidine kinase 2/3/4 (cytokinin receptor)